MLSPSYTYNYPFLGMYIPNHLVYQNQFLFLRLQEKKTSTHLYDKKVQKIYKREFWLHNSNPVSNVSSVFEGRKKKEKNTLSVPHAWFRLMLTLVKKREKVMSDFLIVADKLTYTLRLNAFKGESHPTESEN